jgi:hypothetical protein
VVGSLVECADILNGSEKIMQRRWIVTGIIAATMFAACSNAESCKTTEADKTAVADTLRTMYAAASVDDLTKLHTVVAPTFYAFDGGERYGSIDALMKVVKTMQDRGVKFVWNVKEPEVIVHCNEAWITYVNDGSMQMPDSAMPVPTKWLESAVLEKQGGSWKLVFFHSTRVPAAAVSH